MAKKETENKKTKKTNQDNKIKKETKKKEVTKTKETKKIDPKVEEEGSYVRTLFAAILIVIIFIGGYLAVQYKKNNTTDSRNEYKMTDDESHFKEEYENLNNTTRSNGNKNKEISIIEDNNITYITIDEAADILDNGSGIIYFGYAADPYSRNAVPVLLNAMDNTSLDNIYYVNIRPNDNEENDLRDIYNLNDKNKAKKTKEASNAYYEVVTSLANYLNEYILYTSKGKEVDTGVKRLNTPTVVAIKDGEVIDFHEGTVADHNLAEDESLRDLTEEESSELLNAYTTLISRYLGTDCGVGEERGC